MHWMRANKLRFNPDRAEFLVVGPDLAPGSGNTVMLNGDILPWEAYTPILGEFLDRIPLTSFTWFSSNLVFRKEGFYCHYSHPCFIHVLILQPALHGSSIGKHTETPECSSAYAVQGEQVLTYYYCVIGVALGPDYFPALVQVLVLTSKVLYCLRPEYLIKQHGKQCQYLNYGDAGGALAPGAKITGGPAPNPDLPFSSHSHCLPCLPPHLFTIATPPPPMPFSTLPPPFAFSSLQLFWCVSLCHMGCREKY